MLGYDNLVVDMAGIDTKKRMIISDTILDVTHSLQCRDSSDVKSGGRRSQILDIIKVGIQKYRGHFLGSHPMLTRLCHDGPSALPLDLLEEFYLN